MHAPFQSYGGGLTMREPVRAGRSRIKWRPLPVAVDAAPSARRPRVAELASVEALPDLLHPEPRYLLDREALASQLAFAFAGGDAADGIRRVLAELDPAPSEWRPESFARHLFVDELVKTACRVDLDGGPAEIDTHFLVQLLTRPPTDAKVRDFRREILAELVDGTEHREELTELYRRLRHLKGMFLLVAPPARQDLTRHRLEVLGAMRGVLEHLGHSFQSPRSGLGRLGRFGAQALASDHYRRLRDLLDHDHQRAHVLVQLRLGGDGKVRGVEVQSLVESPNESFRFSPLRRWWMKLALWARGYGFSEDALIDQWIDGVYQELSPWLPALFQIASHVEYYLAALAFKDAAERRGLAVCLPELDEQGPPLLERLFNPLLFAQGVTPVPCDLLRTGPGTTTIITGPNSGGKTRLLQAVGLTQLLAQSGFFVPAARARLRPVPMIFCSLVQEETFDQGEGRLGTELLRIRRLFEEAKPGALVVLDELCSGTNPSEGEEIFMLVVSLLHELGPETLVTSHFLDFASRLAEQSDSRLRFLQVELDERERPTYAFVPGVARTSLATRAAARLGVTKDELLALIHRHSH